MVLHSVDEYWHVPHFEKVRLALADEMSWHWCLDCMCMHCCRILLHFHC